MQCPHRLSCVSICTQLTSLYTERRTNFVPMQKGLLGQLVAKRNMKRLPNGAWPDHIPRRQVSFLFCSVLCFDISISIVWQAVFSSMASLFNSTLAHAQPVFVNIQMTCILHTTVHTSVCLYLCFNISSTSIASLLKSQLLALE